MKQLQLNKRKGRHIKKEQNQRYNQADIGKERKNKEKETTERERERERERKIRTANSNEHLVAVEVLRRKMLSQLTKLFVK